MRTPVLVVLLLASFLLSAPQGSFSAGQEKAAGGGTTAQASLVKVKITTGGGLYGTVKSQYKVGEEIPVVISLTNLTDKPLKYCLSTFIFQNRFELHRDGQLVPQATRLFKRAEEEDFVLKCEASAARQFYYLQPKEPRVVDWSTLNTGIAAGYVRLGVGRYELILKRRIECCQGPFVDSDKISFDIVP